MRYRNPAASAPPMRGEITQLITMAPMVSQFTSPQPPAAIPAPMTAPMIECVVDTGAPTAVARLSQSAPASNAANITQANVVASPICAGSMMPPLMVPTTSPPATMAPSASNTAATTMAQPMVMAPEPTDGPMLLATSLAPMFMAM